ncbi:MAG: GNAT family N-acetyltransferase [Clostridia bacterium]|nr:GNAT family N-acetyltransferase [Clostridia bacterium]
MIIRHFEIKDIKVLQKFRYPEKSDLEILALINEWNKGGCSGRYFEMFSAVNGGEVVGELSIHEYAKDSVNLGIHIFEPYRRKGYATKCLAFALKRATELSYPFAISLVEKDNAIASHILKKHGFIPVNEFINPNGHTFVTYKRTLTKKTTKK